MGTELIPETSEKLHGFGATKPPAHPEDGDRVNSRNVGKPSRFCCYQTTSTPWKWGRSYFPKRRKTFIIFVLPTTSTPWSWGRGYFPKRRKTFTVLVLPNHQHTLKMVTELIPETSGNHGFAATKPPAHPEVGDGVISRNIGKPSQFWCYQTNSTPWRWWRTNLYILTRLSAGEKFIEFCRHGSFKTNHSDIGTIYQLSSLFFLVFLLKCTDVYIISKDLRF